MFTVKLSNGTTLTNLTQNGSNFVSKTEVTNDTFKDGLENVEVEEYDGSTKVNTTIIEHGVLETIQHFADGWYFTINEKSEAQLEKEELLKVLTRDSTDIEEMQLAIVELYNMIIGE